MRILLLFCLIALPAISLHAETADYVFHNANVITVNESFDIKSAIAIRDDRIVGVGDFEDLKGFVGGSTRVLDLKGRTIMPGLMDSHTHPTSAAMFEFDHEVPAMETLADVLAYIKQRTTIVPKGNWIWVSQVFITRLREQRFPTRIELDKAAPDHPVVFRTGPDAALNSLALEASGIDESYKVVGAGHLEFDENGRLNGILRGCTRLIKTGDKGEKSPTENDRQQRLKTLFRSYNEHGITAIADRSCSNDAIERYRKLRDTDALSVRIAASMHVGNTGKISTLQQRIREFAMHPLCEGDDRLRIVGIKMFQDGGMLTGSAYMREPWGVSKIYSISDPRYRGVLFIEPDDLAKLVQTAVESKLQFTAHSVGDGAVHNLLAAYEKVNVAVPIRSTRPCITHCNFMSSEAVDKMAKLGVAADIQPAWLFLDTRTLSAQFGDQRLTYFQPLSSLFEKGAIVGGGSDHMQKIGGLRSVNPYDPWLGMWVTLTRRAKWYEGSLHAEQKLTRQQAIRFYTTSNSHILFLDDAGSLEAGKLADFIVVDTNPLECPVDAIRNVKVLETWLGGKQVYRRHGTSEK